nr:uncharacterized protein LOC129279889 [Lytechinus pictus]
MMSSLTSDELDIIRWFKDELQCQICNNLLSNPKSLNCFHLFCLECIEKKVSDLELSRDDPSQKLSLCCPSCNTVTLVDGSESLSKLTTKSSVTRLLESLHSLGLINQYSLSERLSGSEDNFGQFSMTASSGITSIDSIDLPSFVTSVGSQSSIYSRGKSLDNLLASSLPDHGDPLISAATSCDSIRSLRSSGFQCKSPVVPNQIQIRQTSHDSDNASLAISSEGNTVTTKSSAAEDVTSGGKSSGRVLSDSDSKTEPMNMNINVERRCSVHSALLLTVYCLTCKMAICQRCKEEGHHEHETDDLQAQADLLRCKLITMIRAATEGLRTVGKAQKTLGSQRIFDINSLANQLNLMEDQIKANAQAMIAQIEKDTDLLLDQVTRLRRASNIDVLKNLEKEMRTGRHIAKVVKHQGDGVDVVNTSRAICKKMKKASAICASGGAIDRIGDLSVRFSSNKSTELVVGRLQENTEWKLFRQLLIPLDKRGCMQGMVSLRDGRLAVGYETGGIDIFTTMGKQDGPLSRILEEVKLVDLAPTLDGTIIVYPMFGEITEVTPDGKERLAKFAAPSSVEHVSMSASIDGRIFLGYAEHGEIHQFQQSGGNPLKSISMDDCRPQQIDVTTSGKVVMKDKTGVKVLDLTTNATTEIFKAGRGQFAYSTCDVNEHVYVANVSALGHESKASIDKYTLDGTFLETVSRDCRMARNKSGAHWLRLTSLSPFKLAVCDGSFISIYQRQPSIFELANDLGL